MPHQEAGERSDRQRIVDAAWDVLERTTYENLKVEAVIRFAGVSTGSFYRHFPSKQDLVVELLRQELTRATGILDRLTGQGTPDERVRTWIRAVVSLPFGRSAGPRARFFSSLPREIPAALDPLPRAQDPRASLRGAIADGRAEGVFPAADPVQDAVLIHSLCLRLDQGSVSWLGLGEEAAVSSVADFVLAALQSSTR